MFTNLNAVQKSLITKITAGVLLVVFFVVCLVANLGEQVFTRTDGHFYDLRVRAAGARDVDPRIVIVDIDEDSLKEPAAGGEGRWPWPRNRLALLVNQLFERYEVAALGFDVIFSEEDNSSGFKSLKNLSQGKNGEQAELQRVLPLIQNQLDYDGQFAKAIKDRPVVFAFSFLEIGQTQQKGLLPKPALNADVMGKAEHIRQTGYVANLAKLQKESPNAGHINPTLDIDGAIRRIPLLIDYQNKLYESLGVSMVRAMTGNPDIEAKQKNGLLESLVIAGVNVPVEPDANMLVPYRGPYGSYDYISAAKVIRGEIPKEDLQGKIILVGTTAPGLLDLRKTPVGNAYPGVEIHANVITGILDEQVKSIPLWTESAMLVQLLAFGLLMTLLLCKTSAVQGTIGYVALAAIQVGINQYLFNKNVVLPLSILLFMTIAFAAFHMFYGYFVEARTKRQMNGLFGQYVPPELVTEMAKDPAKFTMDGQSKNLSVLFSDVRGFTTISEGLDPQNLSDLMNSFLTPLTHVIHEKYGTIDKYMGDCIMAFWGAPLEDNEHPRHAIEAGLRMITRLKELQPEFKARGWPEIHIGVGINTGRVSVGNMGSSLRLAYTVMGDAVNLASRLEGITKEYGVQIIIGEATKASVDDVETRELDKVRVKGKDLAVTIYEPLGFRNQVAPEVLEARDRFETALAAYRSQQWAQAKTMLEQLLQTSADHGAKLYELYLERIAYFQETPPPADWDGSFTFKTK